MTDLNLSALDALALVDNPDNPALRLSALGVLALISRPTPPVSYDDSPQNVTHTIHVGGEVLQLRMPRERRGAPRFRQ